MLTGLFYFFYDARGLLFCFFQLFYSYVFASVSARVVAVTGGGHVAIATTARRQPPSTPICSRAPQFAGAGRQQGTCGVAGRFQWYMFLLIPAAS